MTKTDLIETIAEQTGLSKTKAADALNATIAGITDGVKAKEGKVTLTGFGTFSITHRKARQGVNPQTGKKIKINSKTRRNIFMITSWVRIYRERPHRPRENIQWRSLCTLCSFAVKNYSW